MNYFEAPYDAMPPITAMQARVDHINFPPLQVLFSDLQPRAGLASSFLRKTLPARNNAQANSKN